MNVPRKSVFIASAAVILVTVIYLLNHFLPALFHGLAIVPRSTDHLLGIAFAPFIHERFGHLASNAIPLFILILIAMEYSIDAGLKTIALVILVAGLGTWAFGSTGRHFGASSIVFGLVGYLVATWYYHRNIQALIVSIIVGFLYGSTIIFALVPLPGISWSGHMFGLAGGVLSAKLFKPEKR